MGKNSVVSDIAKGDPFGGGRRAANAAQRAAGAQRDAAQRQYDENKEAVDAAGNRLNDFTVAGLASLDRDLETQSKNLERQEKLIAQIDPTIIEASQQALKLLRGEESTTLAPLKNQRMQQRQKLLASLREQLGPGAETSTAGIQALNRFDSETANLFGSAQQNALGQMGNISSQFSSQRPDMLREIMGRSGLGQQKYQLGLNQANFDLQRNSAIQGAGAALIGTAGAEHTAAGIMGQQDLAWGRQLSSAALTGGASMLTSGGGNGGKSTGTGTWRGSSAS